MAVQFSKPIEKEALNAIEHLGIKINMEGDSVLFSHAVKEYLIKQIFEMAKETSNPIIQQEEQKESLETVFKQLTR